MIIYFILSYLFAAYMVYDLLTDNQPNPSSQYACLAKFILGPPLMFFWMWQGMALAVAISGLVLIGGKFLTLRKG